MENLKRMHIELKENIDDRDYKLISDLQNICTEKDNISLKLELDYKVKIEFFNKIKDWNINEFMYFYDDNLIGYIGICRFGELGTPLEVTGMVHPDYRQNGIFTKLFELVIYEWKRRNSEDMLILCDRKSSLGKIFIDKIGAKYKHSEYEMFLNNSIIIPQKTFSKSVTLRKAINKDALEISRQNRIYFGNDLVDDSNINSEKIIENIIMPEEEEKRGMKIYIAEIGENIIGKVNVQLISGFGGIYGLGVLPQYRHNGFGREILMTCIEKLNEENADKIMLQVETKNVNALNLYKSCGFEETSIMDYYELKKEMVI